MKILVVEDDSLIAETLAAVLSQPVYNTDFVTDGETAWEGVRSINYDLILLDVMLPKLDGVSLCRRLRSHGYNQPILMITACDSSQDKVKGLDAGADDYIVKPIDLPELLARIRAWKRREMGAESLILKWGDLRCDPSTHEVIYQGQPIHLTAKEYSVLELFLRNGRRVLSRSTIVEHIWDLQHLPQEDTVKSHIKSLRQKLKAAGAPNDFIETVHSIGYRLKQII